MSEDLGWPVPEEGVTTVGVIGWPVEHSLSPPIHNAAFEELGLPWQYVRLPVPPKRMPDAVRELVAGYRGANVTMPHKVDAFRLCARTGEEASRLRAVNTMTVEGENVTGENTDAPGFANFLRDDAGFDARDKTILLYGDGGAARACALALVRLGASRMVVAVRRPPGKGGLVETLKGMGSADVRVVALDDAPSVGDGADLIVNATPLGMAGECPPLPRLTPSTIVVDLVYHPLATPLLETAAREGCRAFGGIGLLVHQAALSFELWTGTKAPLDVMRRAAEQAASS